MIRLPFVSRTAHDAVCRERDMWRAIATREVPVVAAQTKTYGNGNGVPHFVTGMTAGPLNSGWTNDAVSDGAPRSDPIALAIARRAVGDTRLARHLAAYADEQRVAGIDPAAIARRILDGEVVE